MMGLSLDTLTGLGWNLGWHGGLAGGSSAAALPAFWLQQVWLPLGWGLVLAALVQWLVVRVGWWRGGGDAPGRAPGRYPSRWSWGLAVAVLVWSLWPGPLSVSYWLGLAFQAPSGVAVVLACGALWRAWREPMALAAPGARKPVGGVVGAWGWWVLALLGWVLLLDTFAWWPLSLYAWGFGPQALACLVLASLLPMVLGGWRAHPAVYAVPLALLLFVALRLPTGNVWDVVLDPWLWVLAQCLALRQLACYFSMLRK
jgi:hypothetical protein